MQLIDALVGAVGDTSGWLAAQLPFDRTRFAPAFSAAGRKLGRTPISDDNARGIPIPWAPGPGIDECARAALVLSALATLPAEAHVALVRDLVRRG